MDRVNRVVRKIPVWLVYLVGVIPAFVLFYMGMAGHLGVDPVKALEHQYGEIALQLLILGLAITPMRKHLGLNLMKFRRAVGLLSFFFVFLHLLVWLVLDVQIVSEIIAELTKRPYVIVGMVAFVLMIPLAVTSNNLSLRKLGRTWKTLHKLTYAVCLLGGLHFVMLTKGFQLEPLAYTGVIVLLLMARVDAAKLKKASKINAS